MEDFEHFSCVFWKIYNMHRLSEDLEYPKTARFFIPTDWTILNIHKLEDLDYPCTDWEILNIPTD